MGNWSLYGILLVAGLFLFLVGFLLEQIDIINPLTGNEQSILNIIWDWISPF